MIGSAEEFKRWFDAPPSPDRARRLREPVTEAALRRVVEAYPECRAEVAGRRDTPMDLLALLRLDGDEQVRWRVRSNGRWLAEHPQDAEPWRDDPEAPIDFRLTDDERELLRAGLGEWGGPAACTEELAQAMGFESVAHLVEEGRDIGDRIVRRGLVSRTECTQALLATEVVFMSGVVGSGWDWETTTGRSDASTLEALRALQRKLVTGGVLGRAFGTRPPRTGS